MNYKIQKGKVRQIVNHYDPENLIEGGAPEDEYDAHVNRILSMLQAGTLSVTNLQNVFPGAPKPIDYAAFFTDVSRAFAQVR